MPTHPTPRTERSVRSSVFTSLLSGKAGRSGFAMPWTPWNPKRQWRHPSGAIWLKCWLPANHKSLTRPCESQIKITCFAIRINFALSEYRKRNVIQLFKMVILTIFSTVAVLQSASVWPEKKNLSQPGTLTLSHLLPRCHVALKLRFGESEISSEIMQNVLPHGVEMLRNYENIYDMIVIFMSFHVHRLLRCLSLFKRF